MSESININSEIIETIIGVQTSFKGNVKTDKPIRIDGCFEGEIVSTDVVIVTETGTFSGTIDCKEFQLYGKGEGTANCTDKLDIKSGAVFKGDATTKNLVTVEGSVLDGTIKMIF